jgi:hypothetical protein
MNQPHDQAPPLSSLLQSWRAAPARIGDEEFAAGVWRRLGAGTEARAGGGTEARTEAGARAALAWLLRLPASPLAACFLVIASALAGGGAALACNHATKTERMAAAYVRTIDPLQMTHAGAHAGH